MIQNIQNLIEVRAYDTLGDFENTIILELECNGEICSSDNVNLDDLPNLKNLLNTNDEELKIFNNGELSLNINNALYYDLAFIFSGLDDFNSSIVLCIGIKDLILKLTKTIGKDSVDEIIYSLEEFIKGDLHA